MLGFVLLANLATAHAGQEDLPGGQDARVLPAGVIARLGIPRPRDADRSPTLAFSPDGTLVACGGLGWSRTDDEGPRFPIQIRNGRTGERVRTLAGHEGPVESVQFSPSGELLVSVAGDDTVSVWEVASGQRRWSRSLLHPARACFSHDGTHVFVTDGDDRVWVLESATGNTLREVNSAGEIKRVEPSPPQAREDARVAREEATWVTVEVTEREGVTATDQRDAGGRHRVSFFYHNATGQSGKRSVHFLPDGKTMVSVSPAGRMRYRDVLTGNEQLDRAPPAAIVVLGEKSRGSFQAVARYLWPATCQQSVPLIRDDVVAVVNGTSAKLRKTIFQWPPPPSWISGYRPFAGARELVDRRGRKAPQSGQMHWMSNGIAFSSDGRLAALMGRRKANEYEIRIVDLRSDDTVGEFLLCNRVLEQEINPYSTVNPALQPRLMPVAAVFSPDGKRLAVAVQGEIRMCQVGAGGGRPRKHLDPAPGKPAVAEHQARVDAVAFSPDGSLVATAGRDGMTRLWSARSGQELHRWLHDWDFGCERSVAFSPDGKLLAIDTGGQVELVRCSDGQRLHALPLGPEGKRGYGGWPCAIAFTPDARRLAVCQFNQRAMTWWDVRSGDRIAQTVFDVSDQDKPLYGRPYSSDTEESGPMVFSPSLRWFASTDFEGTIYFHCDSHTGEKAFTKDSRAGFTSACFSPDEKLLALGVPNEPIRIIDLRTGATVRELQGPPGFAYPRAFLDDGRILVSDHDDPSTRFWDVEGSEEIVRLDGHRIRACSPNGRYAASVREKVLWDRYRRPEMISATILIWDFRLWREASRGRRR